MTARQCERRYGPPFTLDLCTPCQSIWFDGQELLQLSPGATLELLASIAGVQQGARLPFRDCLRCPRCGRQITEVIDRQRNTRFTYFRCPDGHGRLMTFYQFLRAKDFVRTLGEKEVGELKRTIRQVNCSNCGAPIDIERDSVCSHCRTPVAIIDPDQVRKAVADLRAAETGQKTIDPAWPLLVATERERAERTFADPVMALGVSGLGREPDGVDLVSAGLRVLRDLIR